MTHTFWLGPFGWSIFFIGLVAAIILFIIKRKFYPVMYLVSISLYIFTIGFVINRFDLGKNSVLLLLALSAIIFTVLGIYFGRKFKKQKEDFIERIPSRR